MKTNRLFTHYSTLIAVAACLLSASAIHAQTFTGMEKLAASPAGLQANAYPVIDAPATIRLNFDNLTPGGVWVIIRDEKGNKVYSEFETIAKYRRRLNLASMPAGNYTVELVKRNEQFAQTFTIEPPIERHITMVTQPVKKTLEAPADKKLIVRH